jgi:hypothetical protein
MPEAPKLCHAAASPQSIRARWSSRVGRSLAINDNFLNVDAGKNR